MNRPAARRVTLTVAVLTLGTMATVMPAHADGETLKVMPLGASITFGTGSSTGNGYRADLKQQLGSIGVEVDYVGSQSSGTTDDRENEGHPGWRIDQVAAQTDAWLKTYDPDVVLINLGTNDMGQNYDLAGAPARLGGLIDQILAHEPDTTVMVSTLVPSANPTNNARAEEFNKAVPELVRQRAEAGSDVHLVDFRGTITLDDLAADGIHPDDEGFAKMAGAWFAAIKPVLSGDTGFFTNFGPDNPQPTWANSVIGSKNVAGYQNGLTSMETGTRSELAYNGGKYALMYSGKDTSEQVSYSYNKVYDVDVKVSQDVKLSYWIYPQNQNATHVAVDLKLAGGQQLRDSGAVDQNGVSIHPDAQGTRLKVNAWNQVTVDLSAFAGRSVDEIHVAYDQPGSTGPFRGYIDDIRITS